MHTNRFGRRGDRLDLVNGKVRKLITVALLVCAALISGCGGSGGSGSGVGLSGTVFNNHTDSDAADRAIAGARVVLVPAADVAGSESVSPLADLAQAGRGYPQTVTDGDGHYLFAGGDFSDAYPADRRYFIYVLPPDAAAGQMLAGGSASRTSISPGGPAKSRNVILSDTSGPDADYIGSTLCLICHRQQGTIRHTLHFAGIRKIGPGGTIPNLLTDLSDASAYDLAANNDEMLSRFTDPATRYTFADDGTRSFWLGRDENGLYFQLGVETNPRFYVDYTYGGETGNWRGLFMTTVSAQTGDYIEDHGPNGSDYGYFVFAPFQYNEDPNVIHGERFVTFQAGQWDFTETDNEGFTGNVASASYDLNCAACHGATRIETVNAGTADQRRVAVHIPDSNGYELDGETVQVNAGCEKCHGPGSNHLTEGGNGRRIISPEKLTAGRSAIICGSCHIRGENQTVIGGGAALKADGTGRFETFTPGMSPAAFFGTPDGTGRNVAPFGSAEIASLTDQGYLQPADLAADSAASWTDTVFGTEFNHSRAFRQHYMDLVRTVKFANRRELLDCSSCHSPHGSAHDHMTTHSAKNNAVCLECHNGENRVFPNITDAMVSRLQEDTESAADVAAIGEDVEAHIFEETGSQRMAPYDPEGTAMGRCTLCHMPETARSAAWRDALVSESGQPYRHGDISSHTFDVMKTRAVIDMASARGVSDTTPAGITDACGDCHVWAGLP